jgi:hypothetical protein
MGFFRTIPRSIYSPSFYATAPRTAFGAALGYFLLVILCLTIVKTAVLVVPGLLQLTPELQKSVQGLADSYPSNLVIRIHGGQVTTNARQPYFIPLNGDLGSTDAPIKNLIVIDTTRPFSVAQFDRYQALIWLTKDSLVVQNQSARRVETYDLSQISDFTLDKATVSSWLSIIRPFVAAVAPIAGVFALLGLYVAYLVRLLYLVALAVAIMIMLRLLNVDLTFGESYKLGLYAMTTALVVELLLAIGYPYLHFDGFPFMFSVITLVVVAVNTLAGRGVSAPGRSV